MSAGQLVNPNESRPRGHRVMPWIVSDLRIGLGPDESARENPLDLAGEEKRGPILCPEERLDPETITRGEKRPGDSIPDSESKHSVEPIDAFRTPYRIRGQDDFRIGLRAEDAA